LLGTSIPLVSTVKKLLLEIGGVFYLSETVWYDVPIGNSQITANCII
jgi:hypothetical protein